jgi:uncharacterized membrane protein
MAELFVLGFPSKERAEAVLELGCDLQRQVLLDLEDAALVWRTADGTIKVQQSFSPAMVGAASGPLWGTLLGLLFFMPIFGLAIGATSGAVAGRLSSLGIDDTFVREVAATLEPGSAAVFALIRRAAPDTVRRALAPYQPTLVRASLTEGREAEITRALQEAHTEALDPSSPG